MVGSIHKNIIHECGRTILILFVITADMKNAEKKATTNRQKREQNNALHLIFQKSWNNREFCTW